MAGFSLQSLYRLTELRNRILFTLCMTAVYRFTVFIPLPGVMIEKVLDTTGLNIQSSWLSTINSWCGGATEKASIASLGIMPYISASLMIQLLSFVSPELVALRKEGEAGKAILARYTDYLTLFVCFIHGIGVVVLLRDHGVVRHLNIFFIINTLLSLTATTMFLVWVGKQIKKLGVGEGISVLLCANILSQLPQGTARVFELHKSGNLLLSTFSLFLAFFVATLMFVVFVESAQKRIPLVCPKQAQQNIAQNEMFFPIKVNPAGVTPAIYAQMITQGLTFMLYGVFWVFKYFNFATDNSLVTLEPIIKITQTTLIGIFVLFSSVAYVTTMFPPDETAKNLQERSNFIPGKQPGVKTAEFLEDLMFKFAIIGGVYLCAIILIPNAICTTFFNNLVFGCTTLLILVNVIIETMMQISTYIISAQYKKILRSHELRMQSLTKRMKHQVKRK